MIDKDVVLGDSDIRAVLRSRLFLKHPDEADTVVIEELGLCRGQVRVDVAVVNGLLHGYEIKSDRDSLCRLGVQVEVYGKVFDQATLVVGDRHMVNQIQRIPQKSNFLAGVPPESVVCWLLKETSSLKYGEIAGLMGVDREQVKFNIAEIRRRLLS